MPEPDSIISALLGIRQYPTDDPVAGVLPPTGMPVPKPGMTVPPVNAAPNPSQVMSGVGDLTGVNDAVKALRGQMTPEEAQMFAMGAIPMALGGPEAKAAEELAPPLYSAAAKAIQDARLTKASPEQWLGYLRNQPGVKQEELGYMGALPSGPSLTKDEMQQWANANQVQLKDVTKGAGGGDRLTPDSSQFDPNKLQMTSDTKFNDPKLVLPGGQNYREVLMTMPNDAKLPQVVPGEQGRFKIQLPNGEFATNGSPGSFSEWPTQAAAEQAANGMYRDQTQAFRSSHWDEPNVIAHARMNDRDVPDANGNPKKTLFLEELQSDWHQAGRKQGYKSDAPTDADITAASNAHNDLMSEMDKKYPNTIGTSLWRSSFSPEDQARYDASLGKRDDLQNQLYASRTGVPDAPFKSTWPDLMLKRMVRHAAEGGYDQLAWTPGDVQADRYDLSKQVSSVQYHPQRNELHVMEKNGNYTDPYLNVTPDKLPDYVGKDVAEKLVTAPKDKIGYQTLSGLDLKVGGEGMRAFYDKMLVDKANAIGKKYGARVTQSDMSVPITNDEIRNILRTGGGMSTKELSNGRPNKVWTLPITPELKRAALTKGFPMFAAGGLAAGGLAGNQPQDENSQMLNALRGASAPGSQPTPQQ